MFLSPGIVSHVFKSWKDPIKLSFYRVKWNLQSSSQALWETLITLKGIWGKSNGQFKQRHQSNPSPGHKDANKGSQSYKNEESKFYSQ